MARIEAAAVPEPSALALLSLGAVLYRMRIYRNKDRQADGEVSNPSIQRTGASRFRSVTISESRAAGPGR